MAMHLCGGGRQILCSSAYSLSKGRVILADVDWKSGEALRRLNGKRRNAVDRMREEKEKGEDDNDLVEGGGAGSIVLGKCCAPFGRGLSIPRLTTLFGCYEQRR